MIASEVALATEIDIEISTQHQVPPDIPATDLTSVSSRYFSAEIPAWVHTIANPFPCRCPG